MVNVKALFAYLCFIGIAVLYTLFLEAQGGCYLIIALIAAAAISVSVSIYTKNKLSAFLSVSSDILNKNDIVRVTLSLTKKGFLPSSFITAELFSSYHLSANSEQKIRTALFGSGSIKFSADYTAKYFGKGRVGISSVTVSDYFGILSFRVLVPKAMNDIRIYPDIPEVNSREGLARSLTDAAAFDESEETTQSLFAINGTPGYEHRKYEPGDSLKLINWKLSAKRSELLVRKLEGASGAELIFILDKAGSRLSDKTAAREAEQLAAEGLLGLMMQFVKSELPTKIMIKFENVWDEIPILTPNDISDLSYRMTEYSFADDEVGRLPQSVSGRTVVFTARCDNTVKNFTDEYENSSAAADCINVCSDRIWQIVRDGTDIKFIKTVN